MILEAKEVSQNKLWVSALNPGRINCFLLFLLITPGGGLYSGQIAHFRGQTMGTDYLVKYYPGTQTPATPQVQAQTERRLQAVNQALSTYLASSELSAINQDRKQKVFSLSPLLQKALKLSWQVFKQSKGFFDPSVGPLVNLWGFGPRPHQRPPSKADIIRTLPLVGLQKYRISQDFQTLQKPHQQAYLDFSASAKGLGVDEVALVLKSLDIQEYMIEIGGEIRARSVSAKVWKLAIERPGRERSSIQTVISLQNGSLATSGNYRNYFTQNGQSYGHTINPHTGEATPSNLLSASVIHDNCALADAWATALMAMGKNQALTTANRLGLKALFIIASNTGPQTLAGQHWPIPKKAR